MGVGKAPCQSGCGDKTVVSKLGGGSPFVCAPLVLPPDRAAFVWSTHSCGLAVASAASSLPLPVFFLPRGPVPLLEAWAAPCPFTCSLLREKTGWEASALIRSGSPGHPGLWRPGAHLPGASGVWSLGVQELGHCSDQQRPPPPHNFLLADLSCLGLGLSNCPFCLGFSHMGSMACGHQAAQWGWGRSLGRGGTSWGDMRPTFWE